jgi:hypothetical protein
MWCFVLELAWLIVSRFISPSFSFSDIPDLGLQIFAIYMLYREPGARWFKGDAAAS